MRTNEAAGVDEARGGAVALCPATLRSTAARHLSGTVRPVVCPEDPQRLGAPTVVGDVFAPVEMLAAEARLELAALLAVPGRLPAILPADIAALPLPPDPPTRRGVLAAIESGKPCTWFIAARTPLAARKKWIAGTLKPRGELTIDAGAVKALLGGRSLLPVGVVAVAGTFERGDAVTVISGDGRDLARGLVAYGSAEARRIQGRRSEDIESLLGYRGRDEIIHRDNLVLVNG